MNFYMNFYMNELFKAVFKYFIFYIQQHEAFGHIYELFMRNFAHEDNYLKFFNNTHLRLNMNY